MGIMIQPKQKFISVFPKDLKYLYDSLTISHPYIKYEIYDYLDNIQRMFGKNGANVKAANTNSLQFNLIIAIARYVKVLSNSFTLYRLHHFH